ncbi:MAG TPA: glycosyltransferase [Pyrinomonadaceae bacterium]|nr:glycosyltransferase [Pyrinomonadaceae bacterium]
MNRITNAMRRSYSKWFSHNRRAVGITFLTRSLNSGGAETQLVALAKGLHGLGHSVRVVVFYADGPLERVLRAAGIPVKVLRKGGRWDILRFLFRLIKVIHHQKPAILHGYLVVPNILTIILKIISPGSRIVWGVRSSNIDLSQYDWSARVLYRIECALARFSDLIIVNSNAGLNYALANGFPKARMIVIPNGIDAQRFRPDSTARGKVREKWGVGDHTKAVGLVGRLDPMKDHATFIRAAASLIEDRKDVRFICVGDGPSTYQEELVRLCEELKASDFFIFAGAAGNMPAVYNALDLLVSSSYGEGFSNAIGEAMACNIPCVVTDVGDSRRIVGQNGHVVPAKNPEALKTAIQLLLDKTDSTRGNRGEKIRQRIVNNFSVPKMVVATETALLNTLKRP